MQRYYSPDAAASAGSETPAPEAAEEKKRQNKTKNLLGDPTVEATAKFVEPEKVGIGVGTTLAEFAKLAQDAVNAAKKAGKTHVKGTIYFGVMR